ncbi:MAG: neuraminidase-like domain-containing protein [Prochloraceae cyanobacterium]
MYRKAEQVTTVTFNFFSTAKQLDSAPPTHVTSPSGSIREAAKNELIKHYPAMETLFGSLDFCECEHCRSVLSPAAYFVDLLDFLDYKVDLTRSRNPEALVWQNFLNDWKAKHGSASYPFKNLTEQTKFLTKWRSKHPGQPDPDTEKTPYQVLIERRPDLPCLALTCENTHTALPYIDIVNEILECYVANNKLTEESAKDTGLATTAELLAEPQNILAAAYTKLKDEKYPLTLPFDLWLETVRRFYEHFEIVHASILEMLRPTDELFPPVSPETNQKLYYRNVIWSELLGISPSEYNIFTNFDPMKWYKLYGYTNEAEAITEAQDENGQRIDLNSAKALSRRLGVSYKELVELVKTGFVNPQLEKLVVLRKLGVNVDDIFRYKGQAGYQAFPPEEQVAFKARLQALTAKFSGFNAETWLDTAWNNGEFNQILILADPNAGCNFDLTILRYANNTSADSLVFFKLNLFVRLWRKLGWMITEIDRALQVFIPHTMLPLTVTNIGSALKTALVYLAHLKQISDRTKVGKDSRLKLLTLWSEISTTGNSPLYDQLFLKQSVLKNDPIFDDPLGKYLQYFDANTSHYLPFHWDINQPEDPTTGNVSLESHLLALQGALGLTSEEITLIFAAAGKNLETTALNLENVSLLYRYGLLAKALKLPIRDLIALKELSGIDPFKPLKADELTVLDDDFPFTQALKFIETGEKVKQSDFQIEDLDYLFRHRFDPVGQYRDNPDALISLVKSLAIEIRRIQAEYAIPEDAINVTDEMLRQKLALVMSAEVVEEFLAMWTGTIEYEVSQENILPENKLDANAIADTTIRVTYDSIHQLQWLAFRGVILLDAKKTQLTTENPSPLLANLLDAVQVKATATAKDFFNKHFAGFLKDPGDFDLLFAPIPDTLADAEKQNRMRQKREKLVQAFFPFLQSKLILKFIVQTLAANLNADLALIEGLLTNTMLLTDPTATHEMLLNAFAATGETGVSASFFPSGNGTGAVTSLVVTAADTTEKPPGSNSARLDGYFEVPTTGAYRFFIELEKQNAEAELRLAHLPNPLLRGKAAADNAEISQFTELKPSVPYQFSLDVHNLGGGNATLLIQGETLPKGTLSRLTLYPQATVARCHRAHTLLAKTLQLIEGFALNEREIRYLLTHAADFDNLNLNQLPTSTADATPTIATVLFQQFLRLANYTHLKRDLAGDTDDLIDLFENARRVYNGLANEEQAKNTHLDQLYQRIANFTRRDKQIVQAVAQHLEFTAQATLTNNQWQVEALDFAQDQSIGWLWEILQVVNKIGVSVEAIANWTGIVNSTKTSDERFAIARDLKNTVKAKYETEAWQKIAQPIFDKLRQKQRDALVAYILHSKGFERLEQLFEYFLIDPGMEPVVQTSRIRLAISSVQLFIQRCLLNLEPQVRPTAINSKHWQWMKRYRVWEANRKIFLYPENWLEPEFRDDKTYLFEELEGVLLQGDVSNDLAENAFFNYLKKLEDIARLEIVTMYLEEKPLDPASNTLHVIGRTYSEPHKYFYRRYAHQMWTPWEPVTTEIEGNHIVAVVWRDRLHLFWVTFLEKANANFSGAGSAGEEKLTNASFNDIVKASNQAVQKEVEVQLNWSEYFQGEWKTRESGGFSNVLRVSVGTNFDSRHVLIHVRKEYEAGEERGVIINLSGNNFYNLVVFNLNLDIYLNQTAFRLVSKNSPPELHETFVDPVDVSFGRINSPPEIPYSQNGINATQYTCSNSLQVGFVENIETVDGGQPTITTTTEKILQRGRNFSLLMPSNPIQLPTGEIGALVSPFFYQDNRYTFYVEPSLTETKIDRWEEWVVTNPKPVPKFDDELWEQLPIEPLVPHKPISIPDLIDPIAKFLIEPKQDWVINPSTVLQFGKTLIGQTGELDRATIPAIGNVTGGMRGEIANVELAGELASISPNFSLNVITSSGLNSALLENVSTSMSANLNVQNINLRMSDHIMPR